MEEEREAVRRGAALERRRWRKDEKEQLDELVPKATGRCVSSQPSEHKTSARLTCLQRCYIDT